MSQLEGLSAQQKIRPDSIEGGLAKPNAEAVPRELAGRDPKPTEQTPADRSKEIAKLTDSIGGSIDSVNQVRKELGLPSITDAPPSTDANRRKLDELVKKRDELEKQQETQVDPEERERLIQEEKQKILQEKLDSLFAEFRTQPPEQIESIAMTGKTIEGGFFVSRTMGELEPQLAKQFSQAFKEGIAVLDFMASKPELWEQFDKTLTEEAVKRVDEKLKAVKEKAELENASPEKMDEQPSEIPVETEPRMQTPATGPTENPPKSA